MSVIGETRAAIAELVATDTAPGFAYIPERINPACWLVTPGSPYVENGQGFGRYSFRFVVTFVSPVQANQANTAVVDDALEDAIVALVTEGYGVESAGQPFPFQANNATFTAVSLSVTASENL